MKKLKSENDVKSVVKDWFNARKGYSYAPIQTGMGEHGIHDRVGCIPIVVTQKMVGKTIGLFTSIESKRPGRRNEKHRGMSGLQVETAMRILDAGGVAICCDGPLDLNELDMHIHTLTHG
jgi:hypothetical protein